MPRQQHVAIVIGRRAQPHAVATDIAVAHLEIVSLDRKAHPTAPSRRHRPPGGRPHIPALAPPPLTRKPRPRKDPPGRRGLTGPLSLIVRISLDVRRAAHKHGTAAAWTGA